MPCFILIITIRFTCSEKENLVKNKKVSKHYDQDCMSTLKLKNSVLKKCYIFDWNRNRFLKKSSGKSTYRYTANILRGVLQNR